ncbi:MAG: pyruvate kinase [Parcubacteria group bacterium]
MASRAQIVATVGPASKTKEILKAMVEHQMDVMRLNFSHGTYEEHEHYIKTLREVADEAGRSIPILQDLSGPRMKTGEGHTFDPSSQTVKGVLTEKDLKDLEFGLKHNVEYIVMSFVGSGSDMVALKEEIQKLGGNAKVMAKIERQEAIDNFDEIAAESDAIMIGRGDLGENIPIERLPFVQRELIAKAKKAGKPIITATQMLLSMTKNPTPTRAEVTDVAYAIVIGSDAVMLSEESATGQYPVETVAIMEKIVVEAEKHRVSGGVNQL